MELGVPGMDTIPGYCPHREASAGRNARLWGSPESRAPGRERSARKLFAGDQVQRRTTCHLLRYRPLRLVTVSALE